MVCTPCRERAHAECVDGGRVEGGGRWCDCQHRQVGMPVPAPRPSHHDDDAE